MAKRKVQLVMMINGSFATDLEMFIFMNSRVRVMFVVLIKCTRHGTIEDFICRSILKNHSVYLSDF